MTIEKASSSAQAIEDAPSSATSSVVSNLQSAVAPAISPDSASILDILASSVKTCMETSQLLAKVFQENSRISQENSKTFQENARLSQENSALHVKLADNSTEVHQVLSVENARLRQELVEARNLTATVNSPVVEDFSKFTCFSRLPIELRIKIWKYAAHQPRVVEVRRKNQQVVFEESGDSDDDDGPYLYVVCNNTPPAVIQVSREARKEALRFYRLVSLNDVQFRTYFNMEADILYLAFALNDVEDYCTFADSIRIWAWPKRNLRRVAVRMSTIQDPDSLLDQFASLGVTDIMFVDETHVSCAANRWDKLDSLRGSKNLELVTLSPLDMVKRQAFLLPGSSDGLYHYASGYHSAIIRVKELLKLARTNFEATKSDKRNRVLTSISRRFNPVFKIARLRVRDSEPKDKEESEGKKPEVERKRKIFLI